MPIIPCQYTFQMRCIEQSRAKIEARLQAAIDRGPTTESGGSATTGRPFDGSVPRCTDSAQGEVSVVLALRRVSSSGGQF